MLDDIIKGVSMQLRASFGEGYEIYQNDVQQGLTEPCFFVAVLQPEVAPLRGGRFVQRNPLDVHYFPARQGDNGALFSMAERLWEALEIITLPDGDQLRGTGLRFEAVDGVLHFFVSYDTTLTRPVQDIYMETLEEQIGTTERSKP